MVSPWPGDQGVAGAEDQGQDHAQEADAHPVRDSVPIRSVKVRSRVSTSLSIGARRGDARGGGGEDAVRVHGRRDRALIEGEASGSSG